MPERRPGSRLRVQRVKAGYRLGALAAKVGLSDNGLYRIESGRTKEPKLATRTALATVLGVAQADLFGK